MDSNKKLTKEQRRIEREKIEEEQKRNQELVERAADIPESQQKEDLKKFSEK